jgi:hypothetical protein
MPKYAQIYGVCRLMWKPFNCSKLGAGSARNANQLGVKLIELHSAPPTKELIKKAFEYGEDADEAVAQVLDFLRLWANFHFPQLLRSLDRIQKDVFKRLGMPSGDYEFYATRVENRFVDSPLLALEEYGIPLEITMKIRPYLRPYETLDDVLGKLRAIVLEGTTLSEFEKSVVKDAQSTL